MTAAVYTYTPSLPRYDKGLPGFVFSHRASGMPGFAVYGPIRVRVTRHGLSQRACVRVGGSAFYLTAPELRMLAECLLDAATHIHTLSADTWPGREALAGQGEGVA